MTTELESPVPTESASFLTSVERFFPKSLPTSTVRTLVHQTLVGRDYNHSNTLLATSICPDEINTKPKLSLATCLEEDLLGGSGPGVFTLGGLAGLPFSGISGLQALFGHAPRNLVILLGPHIGVSQSGMVGKIERGATEGLSTACGAAIGAGKKLLQQVHDAHEGHPCAVSRLSFLDFEEDVILNQLRPTVEAMPEDLTDDERFVQITEHMYTITYGMLLEELERCWQSGGCHENVEEIAVVGGIIINQGEGTEDKEQNREDYFLPKVFHVWTKPEGGWTEANVATPPVDLSSSAFG